MYETAASNRLVHSEKAGKHPMSESINIHHLKAVTFKRPALCTAVFLPLLLFPAGRVAAQSAGPLPGATPSDQPSTTGRPAAQVAGKPNLAGTWKLNADLSDNPMQKMRQAQQDSGDQGGGGRRGGYGGGGGGMGGGGGNGGGGWGGGNGGQNGGQNGGGPPNDGDQQGGGGGRRGGGRGMAQLVIEQTPTSAKVSDTSGRVLALYLAPSEQGSAHSSATNSSNDDANAGPPTPVAQWQDNKLVATQSMRNGGATTRTYELSPDNKQLIVTTKVENKRFKEPVTFRQVYDPVYASTGGY
jgi:hypothetical protein